MPKGHAPPRHLRGITTFRRRSPETRVDLVNRGTSSGFGKSGGDPSDFVCLAWGCVSPGVE